MKVTTTFFSLLVTTTFAVATPTPQNVPPEEWNLWPDEAFPRLLTNEGNGCPGAPNTTIWVNHLSRTMDNVDSWNIALTNAMHPKAGPGIDPAEKYKVCETTWSYDLWSNKTGPLALNMNKNGTYIQAKYNLTKGASVTWKVTYQLGEHNNVVNTLTVNGPLMDSKAENSFPENKRTESSIGAKRWLYPCKTGVIRMKIEATLETKNDKEFNRAYVAAGDPDYVGQGPRSLLETTWDFQKCTV
ncbi:hypothetical protein BGZ60DRAFT_433979 [Tricladium varicosporioides]|nr:hypothetical protein BGZ60DRAFT_433979 [Hymenoscyphus varicosporioides]